MRNEQDRDFAREVVDRGGHVRRSLVVEARNGLIENQNPGALEQGPSDGEALTLTTGQSSCLLVDLQDGRALDEVRRERDRLNAMLEDIYKAAPRTNAKAYAVA